MPPTEESHGEEERNTAIARRWLTEGATGNVGLADEIFTHDFRTNGRTVGTEGPRRNVANRLTGFPDLDVVIEDQIAVADKVVTRLTWRGTHTGDYSGLPATGRRVEVRALTVFHFHDGKVFENWTVIDQFGLFQQLGVLPPHLLAAQIPAPATEAHRDTSHHSTTSTRRNAMSASPTPYTGFDRMPLAGELRSGGSGSVLTDTNPYDDDVLAEIPLADTEDVDRACRAAREAQRTWARTAPDQRAAVFERAAGIVMRRSGELGDWLTREVGATRARAAVEVAITAAVTAAGAGHTADVVDTVGTDVPDKENRVYRRPAGVVTVISPWNFPMYLSNRSVAPALALGNAVVLKPAEDSPITGGLLLAKVYEEAGLPPGLLSVVVGRGRDIGDHLVQHEIPRVVSFTGSTPVGRGIAAKAGLKKLALELGGNGPLVVLDDADLQRAAECAVFGSYYHQGQICMATNRVVIDTSVYDEFVDRFVELTRLLRTGDPRESSTQIGPVINDKQLNGIRDKVSRAVADGAKLLLSGEPTGPAGRVLAPHVLLGDNQVTTAAEEVFGPVATLVRADGEEDALRIANDTQYGLSSGVFTRDVERGLRFAQRVEAGMTHINDTTVHDDVHAAFGGEKASGIGRFGGRWVADDFTTHHWISIQHKPRPLVF